MAARYKADAPFAIGFTLAAERACGEVAVGWPCQLRAVAAGGKPTLAVLGVVTDACAGPHVVKRPYNLLSRINDPTYVRE